MVGVQQIASAPSRCCSSPFARDWRNPLTWPWARLAWAYGFALLGALALSAVVVVLYSFRA